MKTIHNLCSLSEHLFELTYNYKDNNFKLLDVDAILKDNTEEILVYELKDINPKTSFTVQISRINKTITILESIAVITTLPLESNVYLLISNTNHKPCYITKELFKILLTLEEFNSDSEHYLVKYIIDSLEKEDLKYINKYYILNAYRIDILNRDWCVFRQLFLPNEDIGSRLKVVDIIEDLNEIIDINSGSSTLAVLVRYEHMKDVIINFLKVYTYLAILNVRLSVDKFYKLMTDLNINYTELTKSLELDIPIFKQNTLDRLHEVYIEDQKELLKYLNTELNGIDIVSTKVRKDLEILLYNNIKYNLMNSDK